MRKLSHQEIVSRQAAFSQSVKIPLTVVLDNIRSLNNVGSIFRTADGAGVEKLWLCGITGFPPQSQIRKTALDAEMHVPWEQSRDTCGVVRSLKERGYQVVVLEQTDESVSYRDFVRQGPVCLVVGNEIEGVSDAVMALADAAVDIRMRGIKNSLNVAVAFGIVAYHFCFS